MKTILIAAGMAGALFIYGYLFSATGHDHDSHKKVSVEEKNNTSGHEEGDIDRDSHHH